MSGASLAPMSASGGSDFSAQYASAFVINPDTDRRSWTQLGTNASYSVIIDFSLRVPNGLQHGISERGDYANRVQGDAASHALNGAPYWTYMRRRAELSTQVFHSNGSEKALSYTRLVRYGGARPFPMVQFPPLRFPLSNSRTTFPFVFRSQERRLGEG